jgi:hypothetical protein
MPRQNSRRSAEEAAALAAAAAKAAKAKKPKAAKPAARAWEAAHLPDAKNLLSDTLIENKARTGSLTGAEAERVCIGIPLAAFSLQYLHSSDVYPLGRMGMLVGESDSCKTAFMFEQKRWFLRALGGAAVYLLNEARDPADLRSSIVGPELLGDGRFKLEGPCQSLEAWQRACTRLIQRFEGRFKDLGGCAFPLYLGLDSITGTTNERVIAKIDEDGCASIGFGQDANLLNIYSKFLFQRLYPWPISFVATSHIKFGQDKYGNKVMKIPGGDSIRYASTYITLLKKIKDIERVDCAGGRRLELKMIKSMGEHRVISVDFTWIFEDGVQYSTFDWHGATVELLAGFTGERRKPVEDLVTFPDFNKSTLQARQPGRECGPPLAR